MREQYRRSDQSRSYQGRQRYQDNDDYDSQEFEGEGYYDDESQPREARRHSGESNRYYGNSDNWDRTNQNWDDYGDDYEDDSPGRYSSQHQQNQSRRRQSSMNPYEDREPYSSSQGYQRGGDRYSADYSDGEDYPSQSSRRERQSFATGRQGGRNQGSYFDSAYSNSYSGSNYDDEDSSQGSRRSSGRQGFASMNPDKHRRISSKGGRSSQSSRSRRK